MKIPSKVTAFIILVFTLVCLDQDCLAQVQTQATEINSSKYKKYPFIFSIGNHAVSMPFYRMLRKPFHPAFAIGTELTYKRGKHGLLSQTLNLGYFYNKYNATGLSVQTELAYRYTTGIGFFGDAFIGAGYLHTFRVRKIYEADGKGDYVPVRDMGKPSVLASFSLGLGYDFSNKGHLPFALFARYQWFAQIPYVDPLPFWPQAITSIGLRFYFRK
ncbi:MAG TPA: hypothetical protein VF691_04870 [Cytophagaceae bacterium]|jgi:hypothetical protein